ncbi:MAG: hypothetical protein AB1546_05790 [bacterium]
MQNSKLGTRNSEPETRNSGLNISGFSLPELLLASIVMIMVTMVLAQVMVGTVRAYITVADQTLVQGNAKWVLDRMASEIRLGFPIYDNDSDPSTIKFSKYGENLTSPDDDYDTVCYDFVPPNPPGTEHDVASYQPGYVRRGSNCGSDTCTPSPETCADPGEYQRITDFSTDIRELEFRYCRPEGATVGGYDCTAVVDNGSGVPDTDETCIFLISITMRVSRRLNQMMNPADAEAPEYEMTTVVRPRSTYLSALQDANKNGQVDCCEPAQLDAPWCLYLGQ